MPTGYTANLPATFAEFAIRCARNFGAAVTMREDSLTAPIPDVIRPSEYQLTSLRGAMAAHDALLMIRPKDYARLAREAHQAATERYRERVYEASTQRAKYETMQAEIDTWSPPTPDHEGLKKFMLQQTDVSMLDCDLDGLKSPKRLTGKQWFATQMEEAERSLEWAAKRYAEGVERARTSTEWLQTLRGSL